MLFFENRIYIPESVRLTILTHRHDSLLAGHPGIRKTRELIERDYWWPKMVQTITQYVLECDICQRAKSVRRKYSGLLHPLPIASQRWFSVTMDFITELPMCEGFDTIMVVVDRHTKMAHFSPCHHSIDAEKTAVLYIDRIFRHHGIPGELITDRDVRFVSDFWQSFWAQLGADYKMSTGFHPQTDGQTERTNQALNQYLRIYTSYLQDNWVSLLPMAEFSINNSVQVSTGLTPFFANAAYNPSGIEGGRTAPTDDANELASFMDDLSKFLTENLTLATEDMKRFADRNRNPAPKYTKGDKVLISTKNIKTMRPKAKWSDKWIGPYTIIKEAYTNSDAYVLELPSTVKMHNVFHTSLLIPYRDNSNPKRVQPPPPPVKIDGEVEDEVEAILDCKIRYGRLKYWVRWKGYGPKDDSWMDEDYMSHCQDLVDSFHIKYPKPTIKNRASKRL